MLDLAKLTKQIPSMGQQMKLDVIASIEKLQLAQNLLLTAFLMRS